MCIRDSPSTTHSHVLRLNQDMQAAETTDTDRGQHPVSAPCTRRRNNTTHTNSTRNTISASGTEAACPCYRAIRIGPWHLRRYGLTVACPRCNVKKHPYHSLHGKIHSGLCRLRIYPCFESDSHPNFQILKNALISNPTSFQTSLWIRQLVVDAITESYGTRTHHSEREAKDIVMKAITSEINNPKPHPAFFTRISQDIATRCQCKMSNAHASTL